MSFFEDFRQAVAAGLSLPQKSLPCRFLYDEQGSDLFVAITKLEDYYPTRTEKSIFRAHGPAMAAQLPAGLSVVELGAGTAEKTPLLLDVLKAPKLYVPVDIDDTALEQAAGLLDARFPGLPCLPVHADFTKSFALPRAVEHPVLGFFPGSTIGNFTAPEAVGFLAELCHSLGDDAYLLIGVDRVKAVDILEQAYDDRDGVTATFNKNLLRRINRELDGDFDLDAFSHRAIWNAEQSAVQMFLESHKDQRVTIQGQHFQFYKGERIHTEDSHKYSPSSFKKLAEAAGWYVIDHWADEKEYFGVYLLHTKV